MYYKDIREHLAALEARNKLVRVKKEINKDTELHPLVRWQFRGLPENQRKAFLFEQVVDVKQKKYNIPVLVASHAASREIYAIGMNCQPEEIMERWIQAQLHPLEPKLIKKGQVQEEVHRGKKLLEHGGLEEFPIPISTPGFDNAPYITAGSWVTKDPETGNRNVGLYRAMVKNKAKLGISCLPPQHLAIHWQKCHDRGIPLEAAIIIGATPNVNFTSVTKIPYGTDEYTVAGGIAQEPVELVKCKTVNLEVPATAQIVIEGVMPTDSMEREGPFGEFTGYLGMEQICPYLNITCITHQKEAIYNVFLSQFPPSESSKLRQIAYEASLFKFLKYDCGIADVLDVVFHESSGSQNYGVIQMKKGNESRIAQALSGAMAQNSTFNKIIIIVNEDIDPRDPDAVNWALSFRMQPHRDIRVVTGRLSNLDPSAAPYGTIERGKTKPALSSSLLIDASLKWDYPPVSLPKKEFMDKARAIWKELGLPELHPRLPYYGYSLGYWTEENAEEAELALQGEHYQTGKKLALNRMKIE